MSEARLAESAETVSEDRVAVPWGDLNGFRREIVKAVGRIEADGEDAYGRLIKSDIERVIGGEVTHGRLYPNIDDVVEYGYCERDRCGIDNRTHQISLTPAGRAAIVQELHQLAEAASVRIAVDDEGRSASTDTAADRGGER
jgi:DNA-binding PadR family transcriptional regulator